jgi:hypothetical protein
MTWATDIGASGRPLAETTGVFLRFLEDVLDFSIFLSIPAMLHPRMLRGLNQAYRQIVLIFKLLPDRWDSTALPQQAFPLQYRQCESGEIKTVAFGIDVR